MGDLVRSSDSPAEDFKRKLQEKYKNLGRTPAAQRMRQTTRVPDYISGKPPELLQDDPFKGSKKVPNFKRMFKSWLDNLFVKPNIPKAKVAAAQLTDYIKLYPLSAEKEFKKENMTPADFGRITKKAIKDERKVRKQISDEHGITSFRPKKRGGKVLANSTRKAKYKAG